jgi:amino acid adenylation domain-containing protein
VKVRGFRVELGEIETALAGHPSVRDSVVVAREDAPDERRLVAYVVPHEQSTPPVNELRDFLSERLPEYMLPSAFVFLESLPVTPNGKVDRRSLPAPDSTRPDLTQGFVAPGTPLEKWLAERWCGALGLERIGVNDNFFELGGDSIKAAVLMNRLQEEIGRVVHVVAIFDAPTISRLARYLEEHCGASVVRLFEDGAHTDALPRIHIEEVDEAKIEHLRRLVGLHAEALAVEGRENLASTGCAKNPPALFVLSPPRSGSTLLRVMLGGHRRLFAPPELELLNFRTMSQRRTALSGRNSFWLEGTIRAVMEVKGCNADAAKAMIEEYEIAGATTQQFYRAMQEWLGGRLLVDKTPSYAMSLEVLRRAERDFDGAKYLRLIRRPQGMIHSFEEAGIHQIFPRFEHPFKPRELAELIWTLSQQNIREFLSGVDERRQHDVVFEELIAEPRRVLEGVCEFLGLAFEDEMLEPYRDKRRRMTDGIHEVSHMLGDITFHQHREIEAGVGERWRKSSRQYFLGEVTLKEAEALGYEREVQRERERYGEGGTPDNFDVKADASQSLPSIAPPVADGKLQTFPLSFAQERLWFLDRLTPGSAFYNCPAAVRLQGQLDVRALERTLGEIVRRHAVLRTRFPMIDGQPVQLVAPLTPLQLAKIDLSDSPEAEREAAAHRLATEEAQRPFNLERGAVRAALIMLDETEHVLLLTMHHIVADGWSVGVLVREVAALYEALRRGEESPLTELKIQYADYAVWQREWLSDERLDSELAYWKRQLDGSPAVLSLPTDRPRPTVRTFNGASCPVRLTKEASLMLRALSQREGTTLFVTLLTAFQALLSRYTGEDDIVVGTPVSGRHRRELETLIGFFVNTLVLRTDTSGNPTFRELLRRVQKMTLEAFAHQDVPFEKIVEALQPERSLSHDPLFQVMFSVEGMPEEALELYGLTVSAMDVASGTTKFDLSLSWSETEAGLAGALQYNTALFDAPTIERMGRHLERMLQSFAAHPEQLITEASLLDSAERHSLLYEWSGADIAAAHKFVPLHELFAAQAERAPHNVAIIADERQLTYAELNARADGLAHRLRAEGVAPESLVGVFLDRSIELVTALLGTLKAGGVYVPLDPAYPPERLAQMLEDLAPETIITNQRLRSALPVQNIACDVLCLDDENQFVARQMEEAAPRVELKAENLAYVIYTSGSTGRPKGVCVSHGAASSHFATVRREYALAAGDRTLQFGSPNFDVSLEQMLVPLTSGASLVLTDTRALSKSDFWNAVRRFGITMLNLPPAYWSHIVSDSGSDVDHELAQQLKLVLIGGDTMPPEALRRWQQTPLGVVRLLNGYGPTETTITATLFEIPADFDDEQSSPGRVPIGRPLANRTAYILDERGEPVPVGMRGELHLGGASLARGYLHLPHLTAERFVPDPFGTEPGARLYKTGDLARYLPDGNIEFLGRTDQQVKIRGYRIETEEVEWIVKQHPAVREIVVIARADEGRDKELVAYVVAREPVPGAELRSFVKGKLPEYMIPSACVFVV